MTHIQVYSQSYTCRSIFAHIRAYFRKFRNIQDLGITSSNNFNEYLLFKSGTSNHCSDLFDTFFHFCFKSIHYFFLQDSISTIIIAIITACHLYKHTINLTHATHVSMPHTLTRHLRSHTTHSTHTSTLLRKERYPRHPRYTRKYATHPTHASTCITPFLKPHLYKQAF